MHLSSQTHRLRKPPSTPKASSSHSPKLSPPPFPPPLIYTISFSGVTIHSAAQVRSQVSSLSSSLPLSHSPSLVNSTSQRSFRLISFSPFLLQLPQFRKASPVPGLFQCIPTSKAGLDVHHLITGVVLWSLRPPECTTHLPLSKNDLIQDSKSPPVSCKMSHNVIIFCACQAMEKTGNTATATRP